MNLFLKSTTYLNAIEAEYELIGIYRTYKELTGKTINEISINKIRGKIAKLEKDLRIRYPLVASKLQVSVNDECTRVSKEHLD